MQEKIFLKRYIQQACSCSPQDAICMIDDSRVSVDGDIVADAMLLVSPDALICVDQKEVAHVAVPFLYYIFNKPRGILCQKDAIRKTIFNYIDALDVPDATKCTLFCVGRLDFETEGLLIITNDGSFAHRILNPEFKLEKIYVATISPSIRQSSIANLRKGVAIHLEGKGSYTTAPARIKKLPYTIEGRSRVRIGICEGKKRQIRKMFKNQGYVVLHLQRIAIGGLTIEGVPPGIMQPYTKKKLIKLIYG